MPAWINFKELRSKLQFENVLRHYRIDAKRRGNRVTALCPLPDHPKRTDNQPRTASLSVNLARNIFQCFGCKASGNALEFAAKMEGFDPSDPEQFRTAALKVAEVFGICTTATASDCSPPTNTRATAPSSGKAKSHPSNDFAANHIPLINAPLDFELKNLDVDHMYLRDRGFLPETIQHFGLGYCNRGIMKGRVVIPLHTPAGQLVGYAGRITDDELISDECPKYRFPGNREKDGVRYEFRKSLLLYNAHRIMAPVDHLFVVEGFKGTWHLWQAKYRNTVGLMGSSCSEEQAKLICSLVKPDGKVWLIPDGDMAGADCAESMLFHISPERFVRWVRLMGNDQPTDVKADELAVLFQ
jgi:DNA primase